METLSIHSSVPPLGTMTFTRAAGFPGLQFRIGLQKIAAPAKRRPSLARDQPFAIGVGRIGLHQRLLLE